MPTDDDEDRERVVRGLVAAADRLAAMADTAELMGDDDGAERFRAQASQRRLEAMALLDQARRSR